MRLDLSKITATSLLQGLQDKGVISGSGSYPSQSIGAGGLGTTVDIAITMPSIQLMPVLRVQFGGLASNVSNYWYPVNASVIVTVSNFNIYVFSVASSTGRILRMVVLNTSGVSSTFSGCTVAVQGRAYAYPWI